MALFLVTGGDGFIGSHLVETLLGQGASVRVLDNLAARGGANLDRLKTLAGGRLESFIDDVRDQAACLRAAAGADYVLHEAGLGSVARSVEDPLTTHQINATGTLNLLQAALEAKVKRFVWASSSSIYGDPPQPEIPKAEDMLPRPISPYGVSKLVGEHYARVFFEVYGLPAVSLRYFNVFGPRQDPAGDYAAVIPKFIELMTAGRRPTIFGDGRQSRDFTYVANVVAANLRALEAPEAPGRIINVANGRGHDLLELVERLNRLLGTSLEPIFAQPRPGDILHSVADVELAARVLGYRAEIDFDQGLALSAAAIGARPA